MRLSQPPARLLPTLGLTLWLLAIAGAPSSVPQAAAQPAAEPPYVIHLPIAAANGAITLPDRIGPDDPLPIVGGWSHYLDSGQVTDLAFDAARGQMLSATSAGLVVLDVEGGESDAGYQVYDRQDGLAGNYVYSAAVDADGTRWLGTHAGLSRMDEGDTFTTFTTADGLPGNLVYDILVARDGSRWYATDGGVAYQPGGEWTQPSLLEGIPTVVAAMAEDPTTGDLWFAHDEQRLGRGDYVDGLTRRRVDGRMQHVGLGDGLPLPLVSSLAVDGEGTLWLGTRRRHESSSNHVVDAAVISRTPDGTWHRHAAGDGLLSTDTADGLLEHAFFSALDGAALDADVPLTAPLVDLGDACPGTSPSAEVAGRVALIDDGGCEHGAKVGVAEGMGAVAAVIVARKQPDDAFSSEERRHRMLLGAPAGIPALMIDATAGVTLREALASDGDLEVALRVASGPVDDQVLAIAVDGAGATWFASPGGVARRNTDGSWLAFTDEPLLRDRWLAALAADGSDGMWVGSNEGPRVYDAAQTWTSRVVPEGLAGNSVRAIEIAADGSVWVGSWAGGASRRAADGSWAPLRRHPDPTQSWLPRADEHPLGEGLVRAIALDESTGVTWFGLHDAAVALAPDGSWVRYTEADGLASGWIEDIHVRADGSVWFATNRGVSVRAADGTWRSYEPEDGLGSLFVREIAEDPEGALWFAVMGGVSRLAPNGTWRLFTEADGLRGQDGKAVTIDVDGAVWLGTNMGLSHRRPDGSWRNFATLEGVDAVTPDLLRGGVWVGSRGGLDYYAEDGRLTRFTWADGLLATWVRKVAVDRYGHVWAGTIGSGLSVLEPAVP